MRSSNVPSKRFHRKIFAGALAILVVFQVITFFGLGPSLARAGEIALAEPAGQQLCETGGKADSHSGDRCGHIGFCVFCSAQGRSHANPDAPSIRLDHLTLQIEAPEPGPLAVYEERRVPPSMNGWKASWSATAPPGA